MGIITKIGELNESEVPEAATLVQTVFAEFIQPRYTPAGAAEFLDYAAEANLASRLKQGDHRCWGAWQGGTLAGVLELRNHRHLALLFVRREFHGAGIGRALWETALAEIQAQRKNEPGAQVTVRAS